MQRYGLDFLAPTDLPLQTEMGTTPFKEMAFPALSKKTTLQTNQPFNRKTKTPKYPNPNQTPKHFIFPYRKGGWSWRTRGTVPVLVATEPFAQGIAGEVLRWWGALTAAGSLSPGVPCKREVYLM